MELKNHCDSKLEIPKYLRTVLNSLPIFVGDSLQNFKSFIHDFELNVSIFSKLDSNVRRMALIDRLGEFHAVLFKRTKKSGLIKKSNLNLSKFLARGRIC